MAVAESKSNDNIKRKREQSFQSPLKKHCARKREVEKLGTYVLHNTKVLLLYKKQTKIPNPTKEKK